MSPTTTTTVSKIPSSSSSSQSSSFPLNVSPFFNSPSHDLILQTPDGQFYIETLYLAASSQVFKNILSLPHSSSSSDTKEILKLDEDGSLFEDFLRFVHRSTTSPPTSLPFDRLLEIRKICTKYDVDFGATRLCEELFKHVKEKPLEVWAIAASHGQEGLARSCYAYFPTSIQDPVLGTTRTRDTSPSDVPKEPLDDVPASALWHLLRSHDRLVGLKESWHEAGKATIG